MANSAKRNSRTLARGTSGFSLVELMVALMFTGLLMAGMAQVFKSSLATFYTSGEILSSARRNRASIDLLYDDLNAAGLFITSLSSPPPEISALNPAFAIVPNQPVVGSPGPDDPAKADQLFFYMDQPLAFEGTLTTAGRSQKKLIAVAGGIAAPSDFVFVIDCGDPAYSALLKKTLDASMAMTPPRGMAVALKDSWETMYFTTATVSGSSVTIFAEGDPNTAMVGQGAQQGVASKYDHLVSVPGNPGTAVFFYRPSQMVRYSLEILKLDPQIANGIPCLVRDQGNYAAGGFVADPLQRSVITENVSDFKAYLSANSGSAWAGYGAGYATWALLRADLDTQLLTAGRADFKSTQVDDNWFRKIPTLVRLDITTRTATKRTEYSNATLPATPTAAYRELVQSLVIVPRHFGLPIN